MYSCFQVLCSRAITVACRRRQQCGTWKFERCLSSWSGPFDEAEIQSTFEASFYSCYEAFPPTKAAVTFRFEKTSC